MKRVVIGNLISAAANVAMFADELARFTSHLRDGDQMQVIPQDLLSTYLTSLAHLADIADWLDFPAAERSKASFD